MSKAQRMSGQFESEDLMYGEEMHRRCVFCGEVKPLTGFAKNGTDAAGETAWRQDCKVCYNIRRGENKTKKKHTDFIGGQKRRGEALPELTHQEWKEVLIFFHGECAYCGATPRKNQRMTRDHLVAISAGGKTVQSNIIPACGSCNSSKGADDFRDWFMRQAFFSQERLNKIFKWRMIIRQVEGKEYTHE